MRILSVILLCLSMIAIATLAFYNLNPGNILFIDDEAFSMAIAKLGLRGEIALTGLPSHLGARHLGPFYLWYLTFCMLLAGSNIYICTLILTAFKVLGTFLIIATAQFFADKEGRWTWVGFGIALTFLAGHSIWLLRVDWINNFLLVPAAIMTVAAFLVIERGAKFIPFYLLAATLFVQTHLSVAPGLLGITLIVALRLFTSEQKFSVKELFSSRQQILSWAIFAILWIPVGIYELLYPSNIAALFLRHSKDVAAPFGFSKGWALFGTMISNSMLGDVFIESNFRTLCFAFLCAAILLILAYLRLTTTQRWFVLALTAQCLCSIFAISRLKPPVHEYYLYGLLVVPPLVFGCIFDEALTQLKTARRTSLGLMKSISRGLLGAGFVFSSVILIYQSGTKNFLGYSDRPFDEFTTLQHAKELSQIIEQDIKGEKNTYIEVGGGTRIRANAYYIHLGEYFPQMMYSKRMLEFPSVRAFAAAPVPKVSGYLIRCSKKRPATEVKVPRYFSKHWELAESVIISQCQSCQHCALNRIRPLGSAVLNLDK